MKLYSLENLKDEIKLLKGGVSRVYTSPNGKSTFIELDSSSTCEFLAAIKEKHNGHLSSVTGSDSSKGFTLVYHLVVMGLDLNVTTTLDKDKPVIDSITESYPVAGFYEREITELLGVEFKGQPHPGGMVLSKKWPKDLYPLRR
jgi:NADH:ubiquinone oxidoreductase subunit C